jgi:hypothetical protein
VAGVLGIQTTEVLAAATAALAFDRLVVGHFGPRARWGSLLFAAGTLVAVAIGQLPFLLGESLALGACWAASGRRWVLAVTLALVTPLASPLAGAFLGLAMVAWLLSTWPRRRGRLAAMAVAALAPVLALSLLFPGPGEMPFPTGDFLQLAALFVAVWLVIPRRERALRLGAALYVIAIASSFVIATPVGGNISRLGECVGAPLAICGLWPHRRWLLGAALVPLVALQWSPAFATFTPGKPDASKRAAYYAPLLQFLAAHREPMGRVEVVPTRRHWEAAYVAPRFSLARGWERQLDTADNPIFYAADQLSPSSYVQWLLDNGVRFVALPDAPLDYAAQAEGQLVQGGVPGLVPRWHEAHWRVFEVAGSAGLVEGPARLVDLEGGRADLEVTSPGTILVRVRYDRRWDVAYGSGCIRQTPGRWTQVDGVSTGPLRLQLRLAGNPEAACPG